jgi:hypothetical protein
MSLRRSSTACNTEVAMTGPLGPNLCLSHCWFTMSNRQFASSYPWHKVSADIARSSATSSGSTSA